MVTQEKLQQRLRLLAAQGNPETVSSFIMKHPGLNINSKGPTSGRTALHWAAMKGNSAVVTLLLDLGADKNIKDLAGFTPTDLASNPLPFTGAPIDVREARLKQIAEMNALAKKFHLHLVYVASIDELERYITDHPQINKIGFLLLTPNIFKASTQVIHVSAIFFERNTNKERFVFLDSAYCWYTPLYNSLRKSREIYFSPFPRQHSSSGCFRESLLVLFYCFLDKDLIQFCKRNSVIVNLNENLSDADLKLLQDHRNHDFIQIGDKHARFNYRKERRYNRSDLIDKIRMLTTLPPWCLAFIEHYATITFLLQNRDARKALTILCSKDCAVDFRARNAEDGNFCPQSAIENAKQMQFNTYRHSEFADSPISNQDINIALIRFEALGHQLALVDEAQIIPEDQNNHMTVFISNESGGACSIVFRNR